MTHSQVADDTHQEKQTNKHTTAQVASQFCTQEHTSPNLLSLSLVTTKDILHPRLASRKHMSQGPEEQM